jgi:hypothetical protein
MEKMLGAAGIKPADLSRVNGVLYGCAYWSSKPALARHSGANCRTCEEEHPR